MITVLLGLTLGVGLVVLAAPSLSARSRSRREPRPAPELLSEFNARMALAGLGAVPVGVFVAVSLVVGVVAAGVAQSVWSITVVTGAAGIGGAVLPTMVVSWRARARRKVQRTLWPDVTDHLVASVSAGSSLPQAIAELGEGGPVVLRDAFTEFARDHRSTSSFDGALDRLKQSLADPVADRIVETLRMARRVGGTELPTVLRSLSSSLRQDASVRSEVEARQSWIRNAAKLGVAAPWLILLLLASRSEAASAYNSPLGIAVLSVGLVLSVVAYRFMIVLGRLPEERRWFR